MASENDNEGLSGENLSPAAVRVLKRARELLQRGWIQHRPWNDERTAFCLIGSLWQARNDIFAGAIHPCSEEIYYRLMDATGEDIIQFWNDDPDRTQEGVLRLIDGILARGRK